MSDINLTGETKPPYVIQFGNNLEIQTADSLVAIEEANRLIDAARSLGEYSVKIVAKSGDLYRLRSVDIETGIPRLTSVMEVPEDRVIISAQNTGNPLAPRDIHRLNQAAGK